MLGKVVLTKVDADTNTCLNRGAATLKGAIYGVYKENGSLVTKLTINANCQAESQKDLPLGNYYVKELSAPKGYKLDPKTYNFNITQNNYQNDIKLTLKDEIYKTTLVINKTYLTKNGVSAEVGATFDIISKTTNSKIATLTIDKSAQAKTILIYDDYIIRQTKTVSGYHLAQDIDFKVNEESEEFSYITLMNEPYTALIKVIKINELGKKVKLANIKFKIKDLDTNEYLCQYQNYPNNILYPGHYKLEEVDEPIEGYLWNKEGLKFTIDEFTSLKYDKDIGYYLPLEFINKEVKGNINIIKLGEKLVLNDNTYKYETIFLDGILYGLYDEHYNLIGTYETDINGKININNLKLGKYILKELKTKEGYILDLKEYIINLTYKDQYTSIISQDLTLNNYLFKGKLEITKKDLDTNLPLKGVKINIYDIDQNKLIYSGITNKDGKIIIDNLYLGKFYLQEIESLTGYKLNDQNIYFELTANNELKKIDITNEMIKGKLLIHKKDQNNLPLAGVSFNLYDINDNLITTLITDQNGFISIDLKYGKYYLKEISTLDNYELNPEKIYFTVDGNKELEIE